MRRFAFAILALSACFADDPDRNPFGEAEDDAADDESDDESEGSSSSGVEPGSTGEAPAELYGACGQDGDCAQPNTAAQVICVASTCVEWTDALPPGPVSPDWPSPCSEDPDAAPILEDGTNEAVCALGAEADDEGLGHCPDAMVVASIDGVATCWHSEVLSGPSCTSDDDCSAGTHCMGQPALARGYLPNVCR